MALCCGSESPGRKPHLDCIVGRDKIVQESLLQSEELIVREVLLMVVVARDQSLGRGLMVCKTGCQMGNKA